MEVKIYKYYSGSTQYFFEASVTSNLSANGSYDIPLSWGGGKYYIRAYYGTGNNDYKSSSYFVVLNNPPATSGTCGKNGDELSWSYEANTLTISGTGSMADYTSDNAPWHFFRSQIKTVVLGEGVKSVGAYAFANFLALETVYFPSTLQSVSDHAFDNCPSLTDVHCNFPETSVGNLYWNKQYNTDLENANWHYTYRATGKCGTDLTWTLMGDNTLVISGSGYMINWSKYSDVPWNRYRDDIVAVRVEGGSSIGQYAFSYLSNLQSVSISSSVSSIGKFAFISCKSLETVTMNSTSANIPDYCFDHCTSLRSITIPKNATSIGMAAFNSCSSLEKVTIPSGSKLEMISNGAFAGCTKLGNVSIPNTVNYIGETAFKDCQGLTKLTLPSALQDLGISAFENCKNITGTISIPSGVTTIQDKCFKNCSGFYTLDFGPNVSIIGQDAFANCTKLYQVNYDGFRTQWNNTTVRSGNSKLSDASFHYLYIYKNLSGTDIYYTIYGATGRLDIDGRGEIPAGETQLPWYRYKNYIKTIYIGGSIDGIGQGNFRNYYAIKQVFFPDSIERIGSYAFEGCTGMTDVYYDGLLTDWNKVQIATGNDPLNNATLHTGSVGGRVGSSDIYWSLDNDGTLTLYFDMDAGDTDMPDFRDSFQQPWNNYRNQIKRVIVGYGVTYIGDEAFSDLPYLEEVVIPDSVVSMGSGCFSYCRRLESITLPDSIESISGSAFWNCGSLETVHLPSGLESIPASMFYNCGELDQIDISSTVVSIGDNAFAGCADMTSYGHVYYDGTSAQWKDLLVNTGKGNEDLKNATVHFAVDELAVDEVNFPDSNFRAWVSANADTDGSGWLTDAECLTVKEISCSNKAIQSMEGIQYFPNITKLDCSKNSIKGDLDLSNNLKLVYIYCGNNSELSSVNVAGLTGLLNLDCQNDVNLKAIDVSTNSKLRVLNVNNCNLSVLNVSANPDLQSLSCAENNLKVLDLAGNPDLSGLICKKNLLTKLDLRNHTLLEYVDCSNNKLSSLILGKLPRCRELYCDGNDLVLLNLIGCPNLLMCVTDENREEDHIGTYIIYSYDNKYGLGVDNDVILNTYNEGIAIDETNFPDPVFRTIINHSDLDGDGILFPVEINRVTELSVAFEGVSDLTGIQHFTLLKELYVCANELTELDLSGNPELEYLDCSETLIEQLDLSANRRLNNLDCNNTPLSSLNVSGLTSLKSIDVSGCNLSELDVSDCPLELLWCYGNPLSRLILGDQPRLKDLRCYDAELNELDISRSTILVDAWVNGTRAVLDSKVKVEGAPLGGKMEIDDELEVISQKDGVAITQANFPDDTFRKFISEYIDTDKNGWLSEEEINAVKDITINGQNLGGLTGIKYFHALESLDVADNNLTYLDLSENTNLKYVACDHNHITSLNLGNQKYLSDLRCYENPLEYLFIKECPILVDAWINGEYTKYEWGLQVTSQSGGYMELDPITQIETGLISFVGANMTLGNDLSMNFGIRKADLDPNKEYYIVIRKTYADGRADVVKTISSKDWINYSDSMYTVKFSGIAAKEMNDKIYVQIFESDGTAASEIWVDSIVDYSQRILEKQNDCVKTMLVDMLNYGSAAQRFFKYDTENLANSWLTEEQKGYATKEVTVTNKRVEGENYVASNLDLGSNMKLSMFFENVTTDMYAIVSFTDHYGKEISYRIDGSEFELRNKIYRRVCIEKMVVADARQLITCTIYTPDGTKVAEAKDSIESYVARMSSTDLLYETIMKFADSAYAYFHH